MIRHVISPFKSQVLFSASPILLELNLIYIFSCYNSHMNHITFFQSHFLRLNAVLFLDCRWKKVTVRKQHVSTVVKIIVVGHVLEKVLYHPLTNKKANANTGLDLFQSEWYLIWNIFLWYRVKGQSELLILGSRQSLLCVTAHHRYWWSLENWRVHDKEFKLENPQHVFWQLFDGLDVTVRFVLPVTYAILRTDEWRKLTFFGQTGQPDQFALNALHML